MPDNGKRPTSTPPATVITLTLPYTPSLSKSGTLLIQRGDLAKLCQFHYTNTGDIASAIHDAQQALAALEAAPPEIPEAKSARKPEVMPDDEPTVDIPLKKGTRAVKISHLKIVSGETDAAAYRQAVLIAGRLIDGGLWDGATPIRFDDVYATAKRLKHLTDRDLSLFALEDFVQVAGSAASPDDDSAQPDLL
ncbi:MAG TPA: hypothetical protein PKX07_18700 [Aggregatilineales bacterium]|nr:hypothetical protein [Aggregatilineales bacterium]